jgi:hypothetical protein
VTIMLMIVGNASDKIKPETGVSVIFLYCADSVVLLTKDYLLSSGLCCKTSGDFETILSPATVFHRAWRVHRYLLLRFVPVPPDS